MSTIHSVRKSRRLGQLQARCKAIIRTGGSRVTIWTASTIAIINLVSATDTIDAVAPDIKTSRHSGDEAPQGGGVPRVQSKDELRPRFENEYKSTPHLNPRGAEFESIRLATRIHEWYRDRVPDEELTELPAQKGILLISDTDQAVQPLYLYDRDKDDRDLHDDHMVYEPPQSSNK